MPWRKDGASAGIGALPGRAARCARPARGAAAGAARADRARARMSARDPGHRPEWRPDARILIEDVYPELDGGRYPIKRVVGDEVDGLGRYLPRRPRQDPARCSNTPSRTRTGGRRRSRSSTMTAGWRASGRTGSGAGAIRSRPGPIASKAGAPIWSRSARPGRRSRSNSSRASGSSQQAMQARRRRPTRRGCARSREEFGKADDATGGPR